VLYAFSVVLCVYAYYFWRSMVGSLVVCLFAVLWVIDGRIYVLVIYTTGSVNEAYLLPAPCWFQAWRAIKS
jgi:hypothetical protein